MPPRQVRPLWQWITTAIVMSEYKSAARHYGHYASRSCSHLPFFFSDIFFSLILARTLLLFSTWEKPSDMVNEFARREVRGWKLLHCNMKTNLLSSLSDVLSFSLFLPHLPSAAFRFSSQLAIDTRQRLSSASPPWSSPVTDFSILLFGSFVSTSFILKRIL